MPASDPNTNTSLAALCCLFLTGVCGAAAGADTSPEPGLSEAEFFEEVPVVLSATRLAQPKDEAPAPITVITREMIRNAGVREVADLFRLVPGFVVGWASSSRVAASQHGLTSSMSHRMQVLVDGRSVYIPVFGGVIWTDLPLAIEDIERIEVVRGPNAASYGTNSFLGVINIITRHASEDPGPRATLRAGTDDIRDGFFGYGARSGDLDWRGSLVYLQDDGLEGFDNSRQIKSGTLRGDYQFDTQNSLLLKAGYNRNPRDVGNLIPTVPTRSQLARSSYGQVRWDHVAPAGNTFRLQAYHNQYVVDETIAFVFDTLPGEPVDQDDSTTDARRSDVEFQATGELADSLRFVWGGGLRLDQIRSPVALGTGNDVHVHYQQIFGNLEWRPEARWTVNAGTMLEHNDLTATDLSPRLAANYQISPGHTLRGGISRATRVPAVYEEMADLSFSTETESGTVVNQAYLASGGLEPETITSYEIGYLGHFLDGRLDLDARLYFDRLMHLIARKVVPVPSDYNGLVLDYSGTDDATVTGGELELDLRVGPGHFYRFNYAYTHIDSDDISQPLTESAPRHLASVLGVFPLGHGFSGSSLYYYSSGHTYLTDFDGNLGGTPLDPIHRLDLRVSHPFRAAGQDSEVALVVQSALGDYNEFQSGSEFQRRIWLEVSMNLR